MTAEQTAIYHVVIQWLEQSGLQPTLIADAVAQVPSIPVRDEDMRQCRSCGTPLCGVCRRCHLLGYMSDDPFLIDDETIPA